jgi:hypothetical protein
VCDALSGEQRRHIQLQAKAESLVRLNKPPFLDDTGSLQHVVNAIEPIATTHNILHRTNAVLARLRTPPDLADPEPLQALLGAIEQSLWDICQHEIAVERATKDLRTAAGASTGAGGAITSIFASTSSRRGVLITAIGAAAAAAIIFLIVWLGGWE